MSLIESITLELFKAVLAGSFAAGVFVLGQAVLRFGIEPIVEMRKLLIRQCDSTYQTSDFPTKGPELSHCRINNRADQV